MNNSKRKSALIWFVIIILALTGVWAAFNMAALPPTAGSFVDVVDLYNNPDDYDLASPDGIAGIIIREDLDKTSTINTVTAVVFDFRGYDTMGESFVLLTAISGAMVVLRTTKQSQRRKEARKNEKEKAV